MDLSHEQNAIEAVRGAKEVYNLAADMGGMGFIENFRVECLRSILVNTHLTEASYRAGVSRYFFSSSACAYNTDLQKSPEVIGLKELTHTRRRPSAATAGRSSSPGDVLPGATWAERGLETHIARFHNIYGPRRHVVRAAARRPPPRCAARSSRPSSSGAIGSRSGATASQTRSFCYIDDCVLGIDRIMQCEELVATPINLGSSELVSINELVSIVEEIAGVKLSACTSSPPPGRRRPQQRQHDDPAHPRLGAQHAAPDGHGRHVRLDCAASSRTARPAAPSSRAGRDRAARPHRSRVPRNPAPVWPHPLPRSRSREAGSTSRSCRRRNPSPQAPWSWSVEPASASWTARAWRPGPARWRRGMGRPAPDRPAARASCGSCIGRRTRAGRAVRARRTCRAGVPGHQPPGLRHRRRGRLARGDVKSRQDRRGRRVAGRRPPRRARDAAAARVRAARGQAARSGVDRAPVGERPGRVDFDAILRRDVRALGASLSECWRAWDGAPSRGVRAPVARRGSAGAAGARTPDGVRRRDVSGCGGGYVIVASETAPPGSSRVVVRT